MFHLKQGPVDSPHKWPVMRKTCPCHDAIIPANASHPITWNDKSNDNDNNNDNDNRIRITDSDLLRMKTSTTNSRHFISQRSTWHATQYIITTGESHFAHLFCPWMVQLHIDGGGSSVTNIYHLKRVSVSSHCYEVDHHDILNILQYNVVCSLCQIGLRTLSCVVS